MFFKIFMLGPKTEKCIIKAGFSINSYIEKGVYNGTELEYKFLMPKNYCYNGEIWEEIDCSSFYEKYCILAKTPFLPFDKLWDLCLSSKRDDDHIGAIVFMENFYYHELKIELNKLILKNNHTKAEKSILKILKKKLFLKS